MPDALPGQATLASLAALAAELGDLKRLRDASSPESLASRMFRRSWGALVAGQTVIQNVGFCQYGRRRRRVSPWRHRPHTCSRRPASPTDDAADHHGPRLRRDGRSARRPISPILCAPSFPTPLTAGAAPAFAEALIRQPRAGATCPGKPRIVLEPPEGHGDHCMIVAALACLLAPRYGASPETAFLAGMAHHLHNAHLPDSGFAGEILLGDHLGPDHAHPVRPRTRHAPRRTRPRHPRRPRPDRRRRQPGRPRLQRRRRHRPRPADAHTTTRSRSSAPPRRSRTSTSSMSAPSKPSTTACCETRG